MEGNSLRTSGQAGESPVKNQFCPSEGSPVGQMQNTRVSERPPASSVMANNENPDSSLIPRSLDNWGIGAIGCTRSFSSISSNSTQSTDDIAQASKEDKAQKVESEKTTPIIDSDKSLTKQNRLLNTTSKLSTHTTKGIPSDISEIQDTQKIISEVLSDLKVVSDLWSSKIKRNQSTVTANMSYFNDASEELRHTKISLPTGDPTRAIETLEYLTGFLEVFKNNVSPEKYETPDKIKNYVNDDQGHIDKIIKNCKIISNKRSCVTLDKTFLDKLAKHLSNDTCLEVYAGNGWLTSLLKEKEVNIKATDNFSYYDTAPSLYEGLLREVEKISASDAADSFMDETEGSKTIICCHPQGCQCELNHILNYAVTNRDTKVILVTGTSERAYIPEIDGLLKTDLTETLSYVPFNNDKVFEYRQK